MGPVPGLIGRPLEQVASFKGNFVWNRQATSRHDEKWGGDGFTSVGGQGPSFGEFVIDGACYFAVEANFGKFAKITLFYYTGYIYLIYSYTSWLY